jgi:hypothetical protein
METGKSRDGRSMKAGEAGELKDLGEVRGAIASPRPQSLDSSR